jgi:hypothetical protein
MKRFAVAQLLAGALLGGSLPALAEIDYPERLLQQRQAIYDEDVGYNYRKVVLPRLTPSEKARLAGARLRYPLRSGGSPLFGYYSAYTGGGKEIVLPVESLRFFSDLCSATAWLSAKGYSLGSVYDYLNMLKYGDPQEAGLPRWPAPLQALKIPEKDLQDAGVESRRSACFSTGVVFILAHEIAHLALDHRGYDGISRAEAQANESDADRLAVDIMSRLGDLPLGALYFFTYAAYHEPHRGDFASDAAWAKHVKGGTHPLSAQRIADMADHLERRANRFAIGRDQTLWLAQQFRLIAGTLLDPGIQSLQRLQGRSVRPWMLAPRHSDLWQVRPPPEPLPNIPFSGYYTGLIGTGGEQIDTAVLLFRRGDQVHGRYSYAGITGTLKGKIKDDGSLDYRYQEPGASGQGRLLADNAQLNGRWRNAAGENGKIAVTRQ